MRRRFYFGPIVYDFFGIPRPGQTGSKIDCTDIDQILGGGAFRAALADKQATSESPTLAAILAQDEIGQLATTKIADYFDHWVRVLALDHTRFSLDVPADVAQPSERLIYTIRPALNHQEVLDRVLPLIATHEHVMIAPLTDADFPLLIRLLDEIAARHHTSYLMMSTGQLKQHPAALDAACRATIVQFAAPELRMLVGNEGDVVDQIARLAAEGVGGILVTDGPRGIIARIDGQWYHAPAYDVGVVSTTGAGDCVAGTAQAAFANGFDVREALQLASAAAAMHVAGLPRHGGWDELREFASNTPFLRPNRPAPVRRTPRLPKLPVHVRDIAVGATAASLLIGILRLLELAFS